MTTRHLPVPAGVVAALAGLLGGSLVAPAAQAAQAAPAITDVRLAWDDSAHTRVRVTWSESAPTGNTVQLQGPGSGVLPDGTLGVDEPNRFVFDTRVVADYNDEATYRIVVAGDDAGMEGSSPAFDISPGEVAGVTYSFPAYNRLQWTARLADDPDLTPGDPLDLPGTPRFQVSQSYDRLPEEDGTWECERVLTSSEYPTGVVGRNGRSFAFEVSTVNEWGVSDGKGTEVLQIDSIGIRPSRSGRTTTLTGELTTLDLFQSWSPPDCDERRYPTYWKPSVVVQQRTSPTAPWTVVGTTKAGEDGRYTAVFANPGPRQYRTVVASQVVPDNNGGTPVFGMDSATVTVPGPTG